MVAAQEPPTGKAVRIGYLGNLPGQFEEAFQQGLRELGYVEGQNIIIEERFAHGRSDQFPQLATELVRLKVAVIVSVSDAATRAAKEATSSIPIVMVVAGDPINTGLIASLARPGGNITGVTGVAPEINGKRLELLRDGFPGIARVGVLWDAGSLDNVAAFDQLQAAAPVLQLAIQSLAVREPGDFDAAFAAATREAPDALLVLGGALTTGQRARIVEFAAERQWPAMYGHRRFVEAGGLISYGPALHDLLPRAAGFVDQLLRGADPASLRVEGPTRPYLVVRQQAADELRIRLPRSILARADEII
jgi:putative ABC transport system substrate-binding protein